MIDDRRSGLDGVKAGAVKQTRHSGAQAEFWGVLKSVESPRDGEGDMANPEASGNGARNHPTKGRGGRRSGMESGAKQVLAPKA